LASLGVRVMGVPMDEQGMQVEEVEKLLAQLQRRGELARVKFIYCTSYYQNPTGLTLSLARRKRLLEIARKFSRKHRILILEDAAYRELRYDGKGLPSIKSFDAHNEYSVLTQTFSKPFAPGLKLGYTVMPQDLLTAVLRQKGNHDFGSANLCQWIALEAMKTGAYAKHVSRLCKHYRRKRDVMLTALQQYMPEGVQWTIPAGGLYVWLTLPAGIKTGPDGSLFEKCLENGVLYVPGEYAYGVDAPRNHLRLCFGQVPMSKIRGGVKRLAEAIRETR
jgi:2-aminoadipate transaminase